MRHHRAFGAAVESLDIVVVDDAKPMQTILRSILIAAKVERVRCFDDAESALAAMTVEPPTLAIVDWGMRPTDGLTLVRTMRQPEAGALALVPVVLITAHPTKSLVGRAIGLGVHSVVAKPFSPATLMRRLEAILSDDRQFEIDEETGAIRLEGADMLLRAGFGRSSWPAAPQDGDVLTLDLPGRARRRPDVPFRPNEIVVPRESAGAAYRAVPPAPEPAPDPAGERSDFAAVRRAVGHRSTGLGGRKRS